MDSPDQEVSPAPSGRGFKGVLAKARQGIKVNKSTTSVDRTSDGSSSRANSTLDKFLSRAKDGRDADEGDNSSNTGIGRLVTAVGKRRKKNKRNVQEIDGEDKEPARGRSLANGGNGDGNSSGYRGTDNPSRSTLDEDDGSSLLTFDSGVESPATSPPPLISHQSHIGYLTATSPEITATTIPALNFGSQSPPPPSPQPSSRSDSFPVRTTSIGTNLAPNNAATFNPKTSSTVSVDSSGSGKSNKSRGISPSTKIKDALKPASRKKDSTPNGSPERGSASLGGTTTLGGLFNKDKKGSLSSRRGSKAAEEAHIPPAIQTQGANTKSNKNTLPVLSTRPKTPPSASTQTPVTTVITPPTPIDRVERDALPDSPSKKSVLASSTDGNTNVVKSASGNMISHRRIRSDPSNHQPSKLSNAMSAPLTPMSEEGSVPASRTTSGNQASTGSFFSSVFSAAQNAANTFTNTLNSNPPRPRSATQMANDNESKPSQLPPTTSTEKESDASVATQQNQRAIDTIGTGDLNLSHLGIFTDDANSASPSNSPVGQKPNGNTNTTNTSMQKDEASARAEDISAARAVSMAYGEKSASNPTSTSAAGDATHNPNARSAYEPSITGDKTPPNGSLFEAEGGLFRSGSVRSKVEKVTRRHRNSSATTGTTIAAGLGASHVGVSNPALNGSVPKLTGFAVASKKRNRDFHQLFRSVPEDDFLIEDYSCALQRDIILAGRIYISEGHICFSSNILGWVTTLIISFDEVVSIEKENTLGVLPNAIAIQTLQARHTFRSLLSREATYDLLIGIWKLSHPSLNHSQNGARVVDGGTGDKTEKAEPSNSVSEDESEDSLDEDDGDVYDEDDEGDEEAGSFVGTIDGRSIAGSEPAETQAKSVARKASAIGVAAGQAAGSVPTQSDAKNAEKAGAAATASADYPGPSTHAPTECTDKDTHYDKVLKDEVIPAPLGKIYSMVFGPASGGFMSKWLMDDIKVTDLQMEDDKKGLSLENPSRTYTYIKPLNAPIGPKSTKCIVTEQLDSMDLERSVSVTVTTQTPDVPSGNVFSTKTKFCLMWGPGNGTRFFMNCTIEWTGKSWLKGPIEKGANDGQLTYANDLVKALRAGVSSRPRAGTTASRLKKGGRRKKGDLDAARTPPSPSAAKPEAQASNWGPLEPIHSLLSPVLDVLQPLLNANSVIGLLLFLLVISWFRNSRLKTHPSGTNFGGLSTPQRIAAYEEIWRNEESALWDWLEERVGMQEGVTYPVTGRSNGDASKRARKAKGNVLKGKGDEAAGMARKEVEWAIGVTEERLAALRDIVGKAEAKASSVGHSGETAAEEVVKSEL